MKKDIHMRIWGGMKKKTRVIIILLSAFIVIGGIVLVNYLASVQQYKNAVKTTVYENINASHLADGVYIGEYDVNFIYAKVAVTVKNGTMVNVELLEHRHERGILAEGIEQRIVDEQRIDVDAVSGATNSSTVIKKAVDNALSNEPQ